MSERVRKEAKENERVREKERKKDSVKGRKYLRL